jgi:hypothetical protein
MKINHVCQGFFYFSRCAGTVGRLHHLILKGGAMNIKFHTPGLSIALCLFLISLSSLMQIGTVFAAMPGIVLGQTDYPVAGYANYVITVDLDDDKWIDIVASTSSSVIAVLMNNGDGTFAPPVNYATGEIPNCVVSGFFNDDIYPDVAVTNKFDNTVALFLNNGDGTLQPALTFDAAVGMPIYMASADFDGDDYADLSIIGGDPYDSLTILLNDGTGNLAVASNSQIDYNPKQIISDDFNGDSMADLVILHQATLADLPANPVWVMFGIGDGTFQTPTYIDAPMSERAMGAMDFDGDLDIDLVIGSDDIDVAWGIWAVWLNNGNGVFTMSGFNELYSGFLMDHFVSRDFDNNGHMDIVMPALYGSPELRFYLHDGSYTEPSALSYALGYNSNSIASADFNDDGKDDIVVDAQVVSVLLNDCVGEGCGRQCGDNNNDGVINVGDVVYMIICAMSIGPCPNPTCIADANGDGSANIGDAVYLINLIFKGGPPAAVDCCP